MRTFHGPGAFDSCTAGRRRERFGIYSFIALIYVSPPTPTRKVWVPRTHSVSGIKWPAEMRIAGKTYVITVIVIVTRSSTEAVRVQYLAVIIVIGKR